MAKFTCDKNREWIIELDAPTIQRVRQEHDLDLIDLGESKTWLRLDQDLILRVDVLWTILRDQAKQQNLDQLDFARGMVGEGLANATQALLDAVADFFPPERRSAWSALVRKHQGLMEKGMELARAKLEDETLDLQILDAIGTRMDSEVDQILTQFRSATDMPAPSESAPRD